MDGTKDHDVFLQDNHNQEMHQNAVPSLDQVKGLNDILAELELQPVANSPSHPVSSQNAE